MLPESPRWLLSKNEQDKALEILDTVAKVNRTVLKKESWDAVVKKN